MKIDWSKYSRDCTEIDLSFNKIAELNWEGIRFKEDILELQDSGYLDTLK